MLMPPSVTPLLFAINKASAAGYSKSTIIAFLSICGSSVLFDFGIEKKIQPRFAFPSMRRDFH